MFSEAFLLSQEQRIVARIRRCEHVIRGRRVDAALKAERILPAQRLALSRLRMGMYGICIDCGSSIVEERLIEIPAAIRCVECQDASEK